IVQEATMVTTGLLT
nr:immunoglobulin heavy chain junction region [Mus musculus]